MLASRAEVKASSRKAIRTAARRREREAAEAEQRKVSAGQQPSSVYSQASLRHSASSASASSLLTYTQHARAASASPTGFSAQLAVMRAKEASETPIRPLDGLGKVLSKHGLLWVE